MSTVELDVPQGFLDKRLTAFIIRQDRRLFELLISGVELPRSLTTLPKIAAIILASLIHSIGLILLFLAVYILQTNWGGSFTICWSILLLAVAWIGRPHFGKKPEEVLNRTEHPELFAFVDRIADTLHTKPIDDICFIPFMTAAIGRYGIFQQRVLYMGTQLWLDSTPQERVALIAHELGHDANGDLKRSLVLSTAQNTLMTWHETLVPDQQPNAYDSVLSLPFMLLLAVLAQMVLLVYYAFQQLTLFESRKAEYRADSQAAKIGGTQATLTLLEKMLPYERRHFSVQEYTHPPIDYRLALLRSQPSQQAVLEVSTEEMEKIDRKLEPITRMNTRRRQEYREFWR